MIKALLFAIGALGKFYASRAHSITLRDLKYCERRQIEIHEQLTQATRNHAPPEHLDSLRDWLRQWQERGASFDERLQRRDG